MGSVDFKKSIGGLYTKTSKNGHEYYRGKLSLGGQTYWIQVWANTKKNAEDPEQAKYPDYRLYEEVQDGAPQG